MRSLSSRLNLLLGALFVLTILLSIVAAHGGHGHGGQGHQHRIPNVQDQIPKRKGEQHPVHVDELDEDDDDDHLPPLASSVVEAASTAKVVDLPTFTVISLPFFLEDEI